MAPPPTDHEHEVLHDRLWGDPRRRDDRSEFVECDHCGRAVRWIANLGSRFGGNMQIIARPVTTAAFFDPALHHGLVAVFPDRTGFTIGRATTPDDVEGTFLYRCHWDICEPAARVRDRLHRERHPAAADDASGATPVDALHRYAQWRSSRDG